MDKSGRVYERISGIKDIESMKPVRELIQLAEFRLQNVSEEEYIVRKNAYIDHYGDRTVEELKMESRTFRTNPELLDQKIEEYASDSLKLQEMKQKMMHKENELNGNMKEGFFERRAVAGIRNREISRLNRTRIYGMVRSIFQAVGKNFVLQNRLESVEDIYYLKIEEIFDEMNTHRDLRKTTKERVGAELNFKKSVYSDFLRNFLLPSLNIWKDPYTQQIDLSILGKKYLQKNPYQVYTNLGSKKFKELTTRIAVESIVNLMNNYDAIKSSNANFDFP